MKQRRQPDLFSLPADSDDDEYDYFQPKDTPAPRPALATVPTAPAKTPAAKPQPPAPAGNRTAGPAEPKAKAPISKYRIPFGTRSHQAAQWIAEAAVEAWDREHGGSRMEIPVGVVAALALWPLKGPGGPLCAEFFLQLDAKDLAQALRECWAYWWTIRPDLVHRAAPLASWLDESMSAHELRCIKAVARAAITQGLFDLTGTDDPYMLADFDLMSWMITGMRSSGSRKWLGEYHTPPEICELMARQVIGDCSEVKPGHSFCDPAAGTGGMVRAAVQMLRERGIDPATCRWHLCDIDPIAAAGAAVNVLLWKMGPNTTVWCGDTLAQADTERLALEEKARIFEHREDLRWKAATVAAVLQAEELLARATRKAA
ncbi:hypothetical protein KCH_25210 [Kitasatospora cheerisanensis KCTC 2395]|uniref:DNA methylase adenine-specific domain-containing protein n=1 Tax=Kitasatospora cheerisanensis KCTC 2395 TaxID=1348663 RepID=A0A066YW07_9ACTN|nr:hypothetical protein KCH_25210 [Kitasatospora cheerisanensis KCTC 2395]